MIMSSALSPRGQPHFADHHAARCITSLGSDQNTGLQDCLGNEDLPATLRTLFLAA
ncbi:hypothetical protein RSAG8_08934, partial [Rhizoctonia solani AG-8 WAC10335]